MNPTPSSPLATDRARLLSDLRAQREVDVIVIGGGASGLGVALDARLRGLSVLLLESHDFAGGTSSRATKLVHGGVRYLAQGNIGLVREALHERQALLGNAPHLAQPLAFVMPAYRFWEVPFYGTGLKAYDALAGSASLGSTRWLGPAGVKAHLPGLNTRGLFGGVRYWDGQFDDARLALALARTAAAQGALLLNYCPVTEIMHEAGRVRGVRWRDALDPVSGGGEVRARCVVNAAGVWVDQVRQMDDAAAGRATAPMVAPSQGVHLVVNRSFLPSQEALLVPRTRDGRVLFAVPWLGHVILGTTDTPRHAVAREPQALPEEVAFILGEAAHVLARAPQAEDVLSIWVGLRPLVRPSNDDDESTKSISREHTVRVSPAGLVTVTGGKWTTYRAMAEDVLQRCEQAGLLDDLPASRTTHFQLVGAPAPGAAATPMTAPPGLHAYGSEADRVREMPGADQELALGLTAAMVRFAIRHEYARTVEDILARRHRMLFLNAALAAQQAPAVAEILQQEIATDGGLADFLALAVHYRTVPSTRAS
jgi:glycerol-3-phosphate dehydrogenase